MSKYDYDYAETSKPKKNAKAGMEVWDILSLAMLFLAACLALYFAAVFISPTAAYNPFPPKPKVDPFATLTPTITPLGLEPTWTPTATPEYTPTATFIPTFTLEPTSTPFSLIPATKTPTSTPKPKMQFSASFKGIDSTIIHPEFGCKWQGIGGTVTDSNGADMLRMTIRLVGFYDGKAKNELTVSSIAPAYGKSGFEFFLGDTPIASKGQLYLQLLDQSGVPQSDNLYVDTYADCAQNLILVRFVKNP